MAEKSYDVNEKSCKPEIEAIDPNHHGNIMSDGKAKALTIITNKLARLSPAQAQPSIYKVHKQLRNVNEKAYEPEILAIGPYHRGKENLEMMEEHKMRYLKALVERKPHLKVENYISAVAEMEQKVRNCYAESVSHISSGEFIEMLVLDGCFIIELLLKCTHAYSARRVNDPIFQMGWIRNTLRRDMLLFENQIPFFVLCELFDLIYAKNKHEFFIRLVLFFFRYLYPGAVEIMGVNSSTSTSHDGKYGKLINRSINHVLLFFKKIFPGAVERKGTRHNLLHSNRSSKDIKHILDLLHSNWSCSSSINCDDVNIKLEKQSQFIDSATELRNANVKFQVLREANTLFDVNFNKGTLSMAPLTFNDHTECVFRNLIAYEQYFPNDRPTSFTFYREVLDLLINVEADVKLLSQCGIINNNLGDNEVVAKIVNKLGDSVAVRRRNFAYADTFRLINTHYNRRKNRAIAKLKRNYFNSPWAYISFFAALVLLLLTVAQTVFSALQIG